MPWTREEQYLRLYLFEEKTIQSFAQSAEAVEYTDCFSAEG